ncbi:MAG: SctK family type III secretion system sorting platform protein [Opitutaceae bacterium]
MSSAGWFQSLVTRRPDLYRAIYDWNVYPHRWLLPVWVEGGLPEPVVRVLETSAAGRERLGRHYRRSLNLDEMLWDFESESRRLALLGARTLERLVRFAGATVQVHRLARVVAKEERRQLTARIGDDAYGFALRRGRLLAGSGAVPAEGASSTAALADEVMGSGWATLSACLAGEPEALRRRLRLKAPREVTLFSTKVDADASAQAWRMLKPICQDVLTPEENRCFA